MDPSGVSIIFVIGAPGSGKGTLCKRLSAEYRFSHMSVGDVLRGLASSPDNATEINECVRRGELIPVETLATILKSQIDREKASGQNLILLDGFPRRLDQAALVETLVGSPKLVLFFDCPESIAETRFLTRKLAGREADDIQTFRKRYQEFKRLNPDIVASYGNKGILLKVDTSGDTEVSYQKLLDMLGNTDRWKSLTALM